MTAVATDRELCQRPVLLNNWRYLRHDEAQRLADMSQQNAARFEAALENPDTIWRYPWPDEDMDAAMIAVEGILQRQLDRSFSIKLPDELRDVVADLPHQHVRQRMHGPRERGNLYNESPCPSATHHRTRSTGTIPVIEIAGRRWRLGDERTVFRCPFCSIMFELEPEYLPRITSQLRRQQVAGWVGRWVAQVADRLDAASLANVA